MIENRQHACPTTQGDSKSKPIIIAITLSTVKLSTSSHNFCTIGNLQLEDIYTVAS